MSSECHEKSNSQRRMDSVDSAWHALLFYACYNPHPGPEYGDDCQNAYGDQTGDDLISPICQHRNIDSHMCYGGYSDEQTKKDVLLAQEHQEIARRLDNKGDSARLDEDEPLSGNPLQGRVYCDKKR